MGQCISCKAEPNKKDELNTPEQSLEHCANQYLNELYSNILM